MHRSNRSSPSGTSRKPRSSASETRAGCGVSLCGPMVIVDPATGTRATSQPEPEGPVPRFSGFADGPVTWGGVRWFAFPLSMLPEKDADVRQQILLHGLFHRIQPELGLITSDGFNEHLDTLEGRYW